jgi:hypothetical protein
MAPPEADLKRKRSTTQQQTATNKRRRNLIPSSSDTEDSPPTPKRKGGSKRKDVVTGETTEEILEEDDTRYFVRTTVGERAIEGWIPKEYADEDLVAAWEETPFKHQRAAPKKRGRPKKQVAPDPTLPVEPKHRGRPRKDTQESPTVEPKSRGRPRKSTEESTTQPTVLKRGRGRPRKEQSQPTQTAQFTHVTRGSTRNTSNTPASPYQPVFTVDPSSSASTAAPVPQPGRLAVGVEVVPRSSFDPDEFERFSQLAATSSSRQDQVSSSAQDTEPDTSPAHVAPARSFQATGVVQDSQSSTGNTSYVQTVEDASGTNQQDKSSYVPTSHTASGSKPQGSSDPLASYGPTTQEATGSEQNSSNPLASYVPTTQNLSVSTQQHIESAASYDPPTQEASGSNHNPREEDASSETNDEDLNISADLEEEGSPPSSPVSVPETDPLASAHNSSQGFARSHVEVREIPDTFETAEADIERETRLVQQPEERVIHNLILESSPTPELRSSSQSVVIDESTFLDSVLEPEPPSQSVLQEVDNSEVLDSLIEESSPLKPVPTSQAVVRSVESFEDLGVVAEHLSPPNNLSQPLSRSSVAQQEAAELTRSPSPPEELPVTRDEDRGNLIEPIAYEETANSVTQPNSLSIRHEEARSPIAESPRVAEDTVLHASRTLQGILQNNVTRRDFAAKSQEQESGTISESSGEPLVGQSTSEPQSAPSQTQHAAQVVPADPYLSTQDNSADSVLPTFGPANLEGDPQTPDSRHDSSQQTPSLSQLLVSPLPRPPTYPVGSLDSHVPPRPHTPSDISSLSGINMSDPSIKEHLESSFKAQMEEMMARKRAENPFVPKRRKLNLGSVTPAAGSRSPSTIPDRSPLPQAPTSLRESVLAAPEAVAPAPAKTQDSALAPPSIPAPTSFDVPAATSIDVPVEPLSPCTLEAGAYPPPSATPELDAYMNQMPMDDNPYDVDSTTRLAPSPPTSAALQVPASISAPAPAPLSARTPIFSPAPAPAPSTVAPSVASIQMDTDDASDSESLLNDDLELLPDEHIVPLPMEGRQRSLYTQELKRDEDMLKSFMDEPEDFNEMGKVQKVFQTLRAVETHVDLVFAEAAQSSHGSSTEGRWDMENCVKFRFLGQLFRSLQDHDMNIIVVVGDDDERIYNILEKFCRGKLLNYQVPAKGRKAKLDGVEGQLMVTMLASNSSPVVRPPSAIICLDGGINTAQIRKKSWYRNPDRQTVPIIHLVIPRSIGHIERYVSDALDSKKRLHTIFCCLAHVYASIGLPLDDSAPTATKAAEMVANYLISLDQDGADEQTEWPLKPIGSIKPEVVYQTQQSQEAISSPAPATISSKRPLDEEHLDPAKRMRMTPQPQGVLNAENEISHISDSMPGTAAQLSKLQEQLNEKQQALEKVQAQLKASEKRFREHTVSWEKRQLEYDGLHHKHRLLLGEVETCKKSLETAIKQKDSANERFNKQTAEVENMRARCKGFEATGLASEDEKVAEITRLKKELADSNASKARAISKAATIENTLEYTKEQYRIAQDRATEFKDANDILTAELLVAKKQASGEQAALKKLHLDRSFDSVVKANEGLKQKNAALRKLLSIKEDEVLKLKGAKDARMGTRGQSPRTPKPGSRAASPSRDRLNNLRNG